jgi:hypothetical protein
MINIQLPENQAESETFKLDDRFPAILLLTAEGRVICISKTRELLGIVQVAVNTILEDDEMDNEDIPGEEETTDAGPLH